VEQFRQEETADALENVPAAHGTQEMASFTLLYVPAVQIVQPSTCVPKKPGTHCEQAVAPSAVVKVPAEQLWMQVSAPVAAE
jgi:hypothetical protein